MPKIGETTTEILAIKAQTDLIPAGIGRALLYTSQPISLYPLLADPPSVAAGAGTWLFSAWTELVPVNTITTDFLLLGVVASTLAISTNLWVVQFGVGGVGAESAIVAMSFEAWQASNVGYEIYAPHYFPSPIKVAANSRLAFRVARNVASGPGVYVRAIYVLLPL